MLSILSMRVSCDSCCLCGFHNAVMKVHMGFAGKFSEENFQDINKTRSLCYMSHSVLQQPTPVSFDSDLLMDRH